MPGLVSCGMSEPKQVTTALPAPVYEELKALAKARERSMGAELRMAIAEHLATARRQKKGART